MKTEETEFIPFGHEWEKEMMKYNKAFLIKFAAGICKENVALQEFKAYVHARLDNIGIPSDPEPENNAKHGCRIEGRLNVIEKFVASQFKQIK